MQLGNRGTSNEELRPSLVQFAGYAQKNTVMESLFKLIMLIHNSKMLSSKFSDINYGQFMS